MPRTLDEHIRVGLAKTAYPDPDPCWLWSNINHQGYGSINVTIGYDRNQQKPRRRDGRKSGFYKVSKTFKAHRAVWEHVTGEPVPDHMVLDHLCGNRACVNPAHLDMVTLVENGRRRNKHAALGLAVNALELPPPQPAKEWTLFDDLDEDAA